MVCAILVLLLVSTLLITHQKLHWHRGITTFPNESALRATRPPPPPMWIGRAPQHVLPDPAQLSISNDRAFVADLPIPCTSQLPAKPVVPLLSVSLTVDPNRYLQRLLESIDVPVHRILVQIGNSDPSVIRQLQQQIAHAQQRNCAYLAHSLEVVQLDRNPGCAAGWNVGMRKMIGANQSEIPWALLVNSDVGADS